MDVGRDLGEAGLDAELKPDGEVGPPCQTVDTLVFADGEFDLRNWRMEIVRRDGIGRLIDVETLPVGGSPGAHIAVYQEVEATPTQAAAIWTTHNRGWQVDPSARRVCAIRMSVENSDAAMSPASREAIVALYVRQGENIYWTERFRNNAGTWAGTTWTDADLRLRYGEGPEVPDLQRAVIEFGFMVGSSRPTSAPSSSGLITHLVDNVRFEVDLER